MPTDKAPVVLWCRCGAAIELAWPDEAPICACCQTDEYWEEITKNDHRFLHGVRIAPGAQVVVLPT